jgi:hypothetical protein
MLYGTHSDQVHVLAAGVLGWRGCDARMHRRTPTQCGVSRTVVPQNAMTTYAPMRLHDSVTSGDVTGAWINAPSCQVAPIDPNCPHRFPSQEPVSFDSRRRTLMRRCLCSKRCWAQPREGSTGERRDAQVQGPERPVGYHEFHDYIIKF